MILNRIFEVGPAPNRALTSSEQEDLILRGFGSFTILGIFADCPTEIWKIGDQEGVHIRQRMAGNPAVHELYSPTSFPNI